MYLFFSNMISRSMQTEGILGGTNFVADLTDVTRASHVFGLNVILEPLFVFVGVGTFQAYPVTFQVLGHFGIYQIIKRI